MVLARVLELYDDPLTEYSRIDLRLDLDPKGITRIKELRDNLGCIIDGKRADLGFSEVRPINLLKDDAEQLRQALKSDSKWKKEFRAIVDTLAPDLRTISLDDLIAPIQVPWWNAIILSRRGGGFDYVGDFLRIDASLSHSYLPQVFSSRRITKNQTDSMSVSNILITADDFIVLGYRGGHRYSDMLMNVGAGSLEFHSGDNPLFETSYAELKEEVRLSRKDLSSMKLVGSVRDETLQKTTLYVFRSRTPLTFAELLGVWQGSIDQNEHKYLMAYPDDPDMVLSLIRCNAYDPALANQDNPAATTIANAGSLVPPCAVSLLAHFGQKYGSDFIENARARLGDSYVFESGCPPDRRV